MRIHSDRVTPADLYAAAQAASRIGDGVVTVEYLDHGSRSHARAYEVRLSGDGTVNRRRANPGAGSHVDRRDLPYAATWSAWGEFLAHLFELDPGMTATYYASRADFHARTGGLFLPDVSPRTRGQRPDRLLWDGSWLTAV